MRNTKELIQQIANELYPDLSIGDHVDSLSNVACHAGAVKGMAALIERLKQVPTGANFTLLPFKELAKDTEMLNEIGGMIGEPFSHAHLVDYTDIDFVQLQFEDMSLRIYANGELYNKHNQIHIQAYKVLSLIASKYQFS